MLKQGRNDTTFCFWIQRFDECYKQQSLWITARVCTIVATVLSVITELTIFTRLVILLPCSLLFTSFPCFIILSQRTHVPRHSWIAPSMRSSSRYFAPVLNNSPKSSYGGPGQCPQTSLFNWHFLTREECPNNSCQSWNLFKKQEIYQI